MGTEGKSRSFDRPKITLPTAIRGIRDAKHTLHHNPGYPELHHAAADLTRGETQGLQPDIPYMLALLTTDTFGYVDSAKRRTLPIKEVIGVGGVLAQFTDSVPLLQPYASLPYAHVNSLHEAVVSQASATSSPLNFPDQLKIALRQTEGDLPEALWRLFITSRLNARWLDEGAITGLPKFTEKEKMDRMIAWQRSLAACKTSEGNEPQDASGDAYYVWTLATAHVVHDALLRPIWRTRRGSEYIEGAVERMERIVEESPRDMVSDHRKAGAYGNAIGKACVEVLR